MAGKQSSPELIYAGASDIRHLISRNERKMNFCVFQIFILIQNKMLSHLVCGIVLWQPKQRLIHFGLEKW